MYFECLKFSKSVPFIILVKSQGGLNLTQDVEK